MKREEAMALHTLMLFGYGVGCQPNKEVNPDAMLYYELNGIDLGRYLFTISAKSVEDIIPILEAELNERFPEKTRKVKSNFGKYLKTLARIKR